MNDNKIVFIKKEKRINLYAKMINGFDKIVFDYIGRIIYFEPSNDYRFKKSFFVISLNENILKQIYDKIKELNEDLKKND